MLKIILRPPSGLTVSDGSILHEISKKYFAFFYNIFRPRDRPLTAAIRKKSEVQFCKCCNNFKSPENDTKNFPLFCEKNSVLHILGKKLCFMMQSNYCGPFVPPSSLGSKTRHTFLGTNTFANFFKGHAEVI